MTIRDPRVEGQAHRLAYIVQENEGIHLSDKSHWDIYSTIKNVADHWKHDSDKIREENPWKKYNELKLWLFNNKLEGHAHLDIDKVLKIVIGELDAGKSVRHIKITKE